MASNASVQRFQSLTEKLKAEVRSEAIAELNSSGDQLVRNIEAVAPVGATGNLVHSVRKIPSKNATQIRIVAGGRLTVRDAVSAKPYDYARADEFGTVNMPAKPFFFPTYRLLKPSIVRRMKRRLTAAIKKRSAQ